MSNLSKLNVLMCKVINAWHNGHWPVKYRNRWYCECSNFKLLPAVSSSLRRSSRESTLLDGLVLGPLHPTRRSHIHPSYWSLTAKLWPSQIGVCRSWLSRFIKWLRLRRKVVGLTMFDLRRLGKVGLRILSVVFTLSMFQSNIRSVNSGWSASMVTNSQLYANIYKRISATSTKIWILRA